jgi:hypothetical protein
MQKILFFSCILFSLNALGGNQEKAVGARSFGLANNSIQLKDFWSAENNPAGLGFQEAWGGGIAYENSFLLSELSTRSAVFAYPTTNGAFGISINQFGYSAYNENKIGISYGQKLGENIALGVQINYLNTRISEGYGSNSAISGTIGLMADLNEELTLAAVVVNPNRAKLSTIQDERYPTLLKLGLGYDFSKKVSLLTEVVKDIDYDANVKVGIEYKALEIVHFRLGYSTNPALTTFGFGLNLDQFRLDFASGFDSNLGFTPQVALSYSPTKSKR